MVEDPKINLPCSCPGKASVSDCVEKRKDYLRYVQPGSERCFGGKDAMPVKKNRAEALSFDHSCPRNCLRETLNLMCTLYPVATSTRSIRRAMIICLVPMSAFA